MLEVSDVVTAYGKIEALKGVSLSVEAGKITCLLGPNGAGKTTLMYTIAGILRPRRGSVRLGGNELVGHTADRVVASGVALVPENRLVFPQMSVEENLAAGAYQRSDGTVIAADIDRLFGRFPVLKERRAQPAIGAAVPSLGDRHAFVDRPRRLFHQARRHGGVSVHHALANDGAKTHRLERFEHRIRIMHRLDRQHRGGASSSTRRS